jgi:uncharacterized protein YndB with AHSA1/START domain
MPSPDTTLYMKRTFAVPRAKVFEAWTKPEVLRQWFAAGDEYIGSIAEVDLRVGGAFRIAMKHVTKGVEHTAYGTYREIVPNERLVFSFAWEEDPTKEETLITIEFRDAADGTEMNFKHDLFSTTKLRDEHGAGWALCFERMEKTLNAQR